MNYSSPYASTPGVDYYEYRDRYGSPSPTPSPRAPFYFAHQTPQRPATRAHFRQMSTGGFTAGNEYASARQPSFSPRYTSDGQYATANSGLYEREASFHSPRFDSSDRRPSGHFRRASGSVPQHRPATVRPTSSHKRAAAASATPSKASEADAKRAGIPAGYSIKNWDPAEEPILLLGSVFDANSLGKWIYDWTIYHHGPKSPISDRAGEMWLSLISLSGKLRHAEEVMSKIRSQENKEMVNDFIVSGERLTDKLRKLLKACEAPMLKASKRKDTQLGKNAGVEFVETLFGHERELERTERFMQSVHIWILRFDANCEEILKNPTNFRTLRFHVPQIQ